MTIWWQMGPSLRSYSWHIPHPTFWDTCDQTRPGSLLSPAPRKGRRETLGTRLVIWTFLEETVVQFMWMILGLLKLNCTLTYLCTVKMLYFVQIHAAVNILVIMELLTAAYNQLLISHYLQTISPYNIQAILFPLRERIAVM